MPSQVELAAQRIATALAPETQQGGVMWRWATVTAVNDDGTIDIDVGGTEVESVRALASATMAQAGDRVRLDYLGSDAVVTGVLATYIYDPSGGEGTTDYRELVNKPSLEGTTLVGDLMLPDVNVTSLTNSQIDAMLALSDA